MTTHQLYTTPPELSTWEVEAAGAARFNWEYDDGRDRLLALYQKGKDKQWDATSRIDWDLDVDPTDPLGLPEEINPLFGTPMYDKLGPKGQAELRQHQAAWQFSQFLHGEQGAMICSARIVESVPDLDSKFYAATQTMDEARHAETYARFITEKIGLFYPINPNLKALLDDTLKDSRWDMPYLGMQVLIEGLALAAFGLLRDMTEVPLPKQILAYVMQDEARHVAFGRLALRDYYKELTRAELADREEFVVEGCYLMRNRLRGDEVWETLGLDKEACSDAVEHSEYYSIFRNLLFTRIVPCVKDIGLWGEPVRAAYEKIGVLEHASGNLEALMRTDEELAEDIDRKKFAAEVDARADEVNQVIDSAK